MRKLCGFIVTLIISFHAIGSAYAAQPTYTLGSGDKVRIIVFGEPDLSGEFEVSGDGQLFLPLIGIISANGRTLQTLSADIQTKLLDGYLVDPKVSVEILNYRPFYILGEVKEPGSYSYVNGMRVLNAVALGGGFTYRADKDDILIIRANDKNREPEKATSATIVLPGDIIKVEERFF